MSRPDPQEAARLKRQRLIAKLNAKEAELSDSQGDRSRLSEEEIEIEKVRQFNFSRRGFSQMFP